MKEIEKLFTEKLRPQIAPALEKRDSITDMRRKIEIDRKSFLSKISANETAIAELEKTLDDRIISGKPADDILQKIATETAKKNAYERRCQYLADQLDEVTLSEKRATGELSVAIGQALEALRPDVHSLVEGKLWEVVGTLVSFEAQAREVCEATGAALQKDLELSVFRFLNLDTAQKHVEAFTGQIGADFSVVRRRDAGIHFRALMEQRQKAA